MAATPGGKNKILRWARMYVNGVDLSGDSRTFSRLDAGYGDADMTGWSQSTRNYLNTQVTAVGIRGYQALLNDTATTGAHTVLVANQGTGAQEVTLAFGSGAEPDVPDPAYVISGVQMNAVANLDGPTPIMSADWMGDSNAISVFPLGVVLNGATSLSSTTTKSSHDAGAATSNGYLANLHILASSGGTWAFTIEHSTDDAAWSTLATFSADGSAVTSESQNGTGSVNQYVRFVATRTSGTVTAVCSFTRG